MSVEEYIVCKMEHPGGRGHSHSFRRTDLGKASSQKSHELGLAPRLVYRGRNSKSQGRGMRALRLWGCGKAWEMEPNESGQDGFGQIAEPCRLYQHGRT